MRAWFDLVLKSPWKAIDDDTPGLREPRRPGVDWWVVAVLVTVCVVLTMQEYYGDRGTFMKVFPRERGDDYHELKTFGWWTAWRVGGYLLLPMLVIACWPGQRVGAYYISLRGFFSKLPMYMAMYVVFIPVIYLASREAGFRHTYPFYKLADRSTFDLVAWELMYAAQFLALEFFFRGFLLEGLRARFGALSVLVMIVPYTMIHYGKPLPETTGAIFAGLLLGTLAMRTRSIWGGVFIHIAVAITMDLFALAR